MFDDGVMKPVFGCDRGRSRRGIPRRLVARAEEMDSQASERFRFFFLQLSNASEEGPQRFIAQGQKRAHVAEMKQAVVAIEERIRAARFSEVLEIRVLSAVRNGGAWRVPQLGHTLLDRLIRPARYCSYTICGAYDAGLEKDTELSRESTFPVGTAVRTGADRATPLADPGIDVVEDESDTEAPPERGSQQCRICRENRDEQRVELLGVQQPGRRTVEPCQGAKPEIAEAKLRGPARRPCRCLVHGQCRRNHCGKIGIERSSVDAWIYRENCGLPPVARKMWSKQSHAMGRRSAVRGKVRRNHEYLAGAHLRVAATAATRRARSCGCSQCHRRTAAAHAARFASRRAAGSDAHRARPPATESMSPSAQRTAPFPRDGPNSC